MIKAKDKIQMKDVLLNGREKEYAFLPENEGYHHEFEEAARCIREGLTESPLITLEESIAVARITEKVRKEAGIVYPGETAESASDS